MSGFMSVQNVFVGQNASTREEALKAIAEQAALLGVTDDAEAVYQAFLDREAMGETGMTDGFSVPHAKTDAVKSPAVIVFKNDAKLEWPSFDDQPVDIAIALLVPETEAGTTHIKLLSKTAVLLMKPEFRATLRSSDDPQTIADAINAGIEE